MLQSLNEQVTTEKCRINEDKLAMSQSEVGTLERFLSQDNTPEKWKSEFKVELDKHNALPKDRR